MQVCPLLLMEPQTAASAAASMSASSSTIGGFCAQAAIPLLPVADEPVKASFPIAAVQSAAPVSPRPVTVRKTSARWGTASAKVSASQVPTPGVYSLGLNTTVLPAARE